MMPIGVTAATQTFYRGSDPYATWGRISFIDPCDRIDPNPAAPERRVVENHINRVSLASEHFSDLEPIDTGIDHPEIGRLITHTIMFFEAYYVRD